MLYLGWAALLGWMALCIRLGKVALHGPAASCLHLGMVALHGWMVLFEMEE